MRKLWSHRWSRILLIVLPVVLVVTGLGVWLTRPTEDDIIDVVDQENLVHRKVYLISDDNFVVPITVAFEAKETLAEEIHYVFSLLRKESPLVDAEYNEVLPTNTKINGVQLENHVLTLDFSAEFATYASDKEIRVLESLTWTGLQFEDVLTMCIKVDGALLTRMPVANTPIPSPLNKTIGINNHVFSHRPGINRVVSYYQKTIHDEPVLIPVSTNVSEDSSIVNGLISNLLMKLPTYLGLETITELKSIEIGADPLIDGEIIELDLGISALLEEDMITKELYEILVICFAELEEVNQVSVSVDGESVAVNGYPNLEEVEVSSIIYNEVVL